jgi:hypothetical protein
MTLNITPPPSTAYAFSGISSPLTNIRSGLQTLTAKKQSVEDTAGIRTNFSANYNSNMTDHLAKGMVSTLLDKIKPNSSIHLLDTQKAESLL